MAADFLNEKRDEINARLNELRPLVEEYQRLEAAAAALDSVSPSSAARTRPERRKRARRTADKQANRSTDGGRRGRPKSSGKRGAQALELVQANPGITIPELAEKMGIKHNYLYRVLPALADEGRVAKDGRGWHPKQVA